MLDAEVHDPHFNKRMEFLSFSTLSMYSKSKPW